MLPEWAERSLRGVALAAFRGGKSGLHRTRWWVTPTVRKDRESATENRPPMARLRDQARVKRCGKSAPRSWRQDWQGKPRREQDQAERRGCPSRYHVRVGCTRRRATGVLEKWTLTTEPGLQARSGFFGLWTSRVQGRGVLARSEDRPEHERSPAFNGLKAELQQTARFKRAFRLAGGVCVHFPSTRLSACGSRPG